MEQRENPNSSPPLQPPIRRGIIPTQRATLSASNPLRPSKTSRASTSPPELDLWASEPTLRFPLPQGSQDLADWLSISDPNIMRSELAQAMADAMGESMGDSMAEPYEMVSAANTDTEEQEQEQEQEQEDQDPGFMSESIASLDFHRPDDVQSLAGTENTCDEEESVPDLDDDDSYRAETPYQDDEININDNNDHAERGRDDHDDHQDEVNDIVTFSRTPIQPPTSEVAAVDSLSDSGYPSSDDEAEPRSSLHYTYPQPNLGTPSLLTPMPIQIAELRYEAPTDPKPLWAKRFDKVWEVQRQLVDYFTEATSGAFPGVLFVVIFALVLQIVNTSKQDPLPAPAATPAVATMTTTETFTTTATATTTATTTEAAIRSASPQPTTSFSGAFGLIPIGDVVSDDWLFGANKPAISFSAQSQHGVLIHIPAKIKKTWEARNCLTLTAKRGDVLVDSVMSSVDEGIVVRFAKKEIHGIVTLFLEAACRPKVHKVVKIHFGKGLVEGAIEMTLEMTKNIAQDLSKLVPATAQEAERRLVDARRSLGSVCQNVCLNVQSASETVVKTFGTFGTSFSETRQGLEDLAAEARAHVKAAQQHVKAAQQQVSEQLAKMQDLQNTVKLYVLDAQISAKLWWLQTTGRREKRDDYQRKAESFFAQKQAAAREHRGGGHQDPRGEADAEAPFSSWWTRRKLGRE